MGSNHQNEGGLGDEFFDQILSAGGYASNTAVAGPTDGGYLGGPTDGSSMLLGLGQSDGFRSGLGLPLGLNLDHAVSSSLGVGIALASSSASTINEGDSLHMANLFPAFGHIQHQALRATPPAVHLHQNFQNQGAPAPPPVASHPPAVRPRVRARRGQATDPHSIAERLRRERIAERMKALQELVPSCNKTDRAAMLDEIVDYVKFLRLQVKVLSMSRLGGAGAVAQLVADVPSSSVEADGVESGQPAWEKWSNDGTEQQVAKLMEQDIGAAMQFLQSKALCIMPISLASAIFQSNPTLPTAPPDPATVVKSEMNPPL